MTLNPPDIRFLPRPGHEPALRGEAARGRLPPALSAGGLRPGALVMPSPVNAHDHGYGVRPLDFEIGRRAARRDGAEAGKGLTRGFVGRRFV